MHSGMGKLFTGWVALLVLFDGVHAFAESDPPVTRVLVLQTASTDVLEAAAVAVTNQITEQVSRRPGLSTVTTSDLDQILALEEDKVRLGCPTDAACMAKLSEAAQAQWVVSSTLGMIGKSVVLSVTLIDGERASAIGRGSVTLDSIDDVATALPALLSQVFGWDGAAPTTSFSLPEGKSISFAVFAIKPSGVSKDIAQNR